MALEDTRMQMRGPTQARAWLADYIRTQFPTYLDFLGDYWSLDLSKQTADGTHRYYLPHPQMVHPYEFRLDAIDRWPAIGIVFGPARHQRVDVDTDAAAAYRTVYAVNLFSWVYGADWDEVAERRDDYETALRFMLLDRPTLNVEPAGIVLINEETMESSPSEIEPTGGNQFIAGAQIAFEMAVYETILRRDPLREAPIAELLVADIQAEAVGLHHPAFD